MASTYSKVVYDGKILIDLTADTITADQLHSGVTAHDASGALITGTSTLDSDTSDDTATASEILSGKTAHARGALVTGTMANRGKVTGTISTKAGTFSIPAGYHDGSGSVAISATEQAKIVAANIRTGISILGVTGTMTGTEDVHAQSMSVVPTTKSQTITPGTGYNYISQVTVSAIPYSEAENSAGGITATIG